MTEETQLNEWRASLRSRLDEELPTVSASPDERVRWTARHLREYVDRWTGFVEHPSVMNQPIDFAFDSGMFSVIAAAVELIDSEMRPDVDPAVRDGWRKFVRCYHEIRETRAVESRNQLLELADEFTTSLNVSS